MATQAPPPTSIVPNRSVPMLNPDGTVSLPWLRFFQNISGSTVTNINAQIAAINAAIATLTTEITTATNAANNAAAEPVGLLLGNLALGVQDDLYTLNGLLDGVTVLAYLAAALIDQAAGSVNLSALMDAQFGSAQGDILYRDASAWKALAPGTAGQMLQTNGPGANPSWGAPAGTYLLDTLGVAASAAWSLRQLKSTATKAIQVRRDSDNTTMDIGFVSGALDTATLSAFVGANGGWITTWYDQSGNNVNLAQANNNSQPQIVIAGVLQTNSNGKSAIYFRNGFATALTTTTSLLQVGAFSVSAAVQANVVSNYPALMGTPNTAYGNSITMGIESGTGNHYTSLFCDGVANSNFTQATSASTSEVLAFTSTAGVVTNTLTASGYVNNAAGGSATVNSSSNVVSGTYVGCPQATTGEQWQGYMSEIIVWPSVLSGANLTTVYNSQHGAF